MKELHSKILDDFIAKSHEKSHLQFRYRLFQDVCHRFSIHSAYSQFLNDRYRFHRDEDKPEPRVEKKDTPGEEKK